MKTIEHKVSKEAIYGYNRYIQSQKPENCGQYSFERLGIEDWSIVKLNANEVLRLQAFVESSQTTAPAYIFWKECGRHVTLEGVAKKLLKEKKIFLKKQEYG